MDGPRPSVLAIIRDGGKILLTKRSCEPFRGFWCLPGGLLEFWESAVVGVRREVSEEVGLEFEPEFWRYFDEMNPGIQTHRITLVFHGPASGEVKPNPEEVAEWKWAGLQEALNSKLAFNQKEVLEEWRKHER